MPEVKLIFLPHTHWDREWYLPFEVFREKLVELIDRLVEIMSNEPDYEHFLLDGQTIILEDYQETKGENPELLQLIKEERIRIGPWYVLPDEFLVSGESLIRNLKRGFELSRRFGAEPVKVGYLPDMFGHISQMPQILRGFGIDSALVWRGVPAMEKNQFRWQSRDGSSVLGVYLPLGYGFIFNLPESPDEFLARMNLFLSLIRAQDESGVYLILVGTDHCPPEPGLARVIREASELQREWQMELGTLEGYLEELKSRLHEIPPFQGELRSNARTQILPGVSSARLYLKEMNHRAEALLEKYLEPIICLNWLGSGEDPRGRLDYLWRLLLSNHPHDSICGCSIDPVHREMETRYEKILQLSQTLLENALARLGQVRSSRPGLILVWNPAPSASPGLIAFEDDLFGNQEMILEDERGRKYPLERAGRTGKEETLYQIEVPAGFAWIAFGYFSQDQIFGYFPNSFRTQREGEKLLIEIGLGSRPLCFPIKEELSKIKEVIGEERISTLVFRLFRQSSFMRIAVVDDLPGPAISSFRIRKGRLDLESEITRSEAGLENRWLKISLAESGQARILDKESGKEILVEFSDRGDRGDSYNFDPVPDDQPITRADKFRYKFGPAGKSFATLDLKHLYRLPASLDSSRARRSRKKAPLLVKSRICLYSGLRRVDFKTSFENTIKDHRLQVDFWYPALIDHYRGETGFDLVKRKIEQESMPPPPSLSDIARLILGSEVNYASSPIQNFACLEKEGRGMILAGKGLKEISAERDQDRNRTRLSFTLCRSIGYLARADLAFRTGLAGPPLELSDAQCLRRLTWDYSLILFSGAVETGAVFGSAYQFVFPPLAFFAESKLSLPFRVRSSKILLSALYPGENCRVIARFFNPSFQPERLELELREEVSSVQAVNLKEKEISRSDLKLRGNKLETVLQAGEICTLAMEIDL